MRRLIELSLIIYFSLIMSGCGEVEGSSPLADNELRNKGSAKLTWTKPTQNLDDTPLVDLEGFYVYFGSEDDYQSDISGFSPFWSYVDNLANSNDMTCENLDNGTKMTCTIDDLTQSTNWYFVVTAVNGQNIESIRSAVKCKQFMSTICLT